ncbi:unnamed protein product [marine sediment metagenome]|uniref:Uncharacterized protein n=1 Tax=marine sediment metagenome TaxID=412755 RepID=X0YH10_9ZZZZ
MPNLSKKTNFVKFYWTPTFWEWVKYYLGIKTFPKKRRMDR